MAEIIESVPHQIALSHSVIGETILFLDAYGTLEGANTYFDNMPRNDLWQESENDQKKSALVEATRLLDNLNYAGSKFSAAQLHEFPRGTDTVVPKAIQMATYELANRLLDGSNTDYEVDNLSAESRSYGGAKTTYNRVFVQEHLASGIVSFKAWAYIKPYLRDPGQLTLSRVT